MKSTTKKLKQFLARLATMLAVFAPSFGFAQESTTYTVKAGDTLSEIAETYHTTVEKLAEKNKIQDIHLIFVDQVLVIDGPAVAVATSTTYEAPAVTEEATEAVTYEEETIETTIYEATLAAVETTVSLTTGVSATGAETVSS